MTNTMNKVKIMTIAALLCAIGIIIPMQFPKVVIGPASFTLASHVPIFIAMFISPTVAVSVAIITGFGFLIAGLPVIIAFRAFTHLIFATLGAFLLKKNGNIMNSFKTAVPYSLGISFIHAIAEVFVVSFFYFGNSSQITEASYSNGYVMSVLILIGFGGLIHSIVDLSIATFVWKSLRQVVTIPSSMSLKTK